MDIRTFNDKDALHMKATMARWIIAGWAFAVATCMAGDDFKPWPRNVKPDRAYYDSLSDNEFDSLNPGPIFFKFFIDEWRQRPLTGKFFALGSHSYAQDESVTFNKGVFTNYEDVRLLGRTINELSQAKNRTAVPVLKDAFTVVKDLKLKSDLLRCLARYDAAFDKKELQSLLASDDAYLRGGAATLYSVQKGSKASVLLKRAADEKGFRRLSMIELATRCEDAGTVGQWQPFLKTEAETVKAVPGVLRATGSNLDSVLNALCNNASPSVRFVFASNHRLWPKNVTVGFLRKLSKDSLSTVRKEVAEAIGFGRLNDLLPQLHALAASTPASVRAQAAISFRHFPEAKSFATLTTLTGDDRFQVREAAKESMLAMSGTYDVDAAIAANMTNSNPYIRFNAYLVSIALKSTRHAALLAKTVPKEKDPEILAAGMKAWVIAGGDASRSFILSKANHKSVLVRIEMAYAIGRQRWTQGYDLLKKCVLNTKNEPEYRRVALIAMGMTENGVFSKELLWTLKNVLKSTSDQRAAAAWSAARLQKPSKPLINRLLTQVVAKVIPGPPPSYDAKWVRISATFALNVMAKRGISQATGSASGALSSLGGGGRDAPSGPNYTYYVNQIENFLSKKPIGAAVATPTRYIFSFRPARRRAQ